ncbi:MAG: transposase [Magnetococcales bacterium]|nr:transposase [Magnetococcales bacterium]
MPHVNSVCMQVFLDEIGGRYPDDRIIMVMDGAGWHKGQSLIPPVNMRILFLPSYSPELNPMEHIWDELREKWFHNNVFASLDALEQHLESALLTLEDDHARVKSIVAWPWIINAL